MLFAKDIPPRCIWCRHGEPMGDGRVICRYKGPVDGEGKCRRWQYDAYKRIPPAKKGPRMPSLPLSLEEDGDKN
ncbi:MAG: hypothetical protein IKL89_00790 [Clostridia bacterium]|nr:hypothetical protein [Clostridia bacterium]